MQTTGVIKAIRAGLHDDQVILEISLTGEFREYDDIYMPISKTAAWNVHVGDEIRFNFTVTS